ncbi:ABC transporter substrate-binding protein [Desulfocurvus sp. DL9XJH121]
MLRVACVAAVLLWAVSARAGSVFVVDSYHDRYPWVRECHTGLEQALGGNHELRYFALDTKRAPGDRFAPRAEAAMEACREASPDVVVLVDDNAVRLLGQRLSDEGRIVVFMGVNHNPRVYFRGHRIPTNVTGVLERPEVQRTAKLLCEILHPCPKRLAVLFDDGDTSRAIIESSFGGKAQITVSGISLDAKMTGSFARWKRMVLGLADEGYEALVLAGYAALRDEEGLQVPLDTVTEWTAANSPLPVFSFWKFSLGKGKALGGLLIDGEDQGRAAANLVKAYLEQGVLEPVVFPANGTLVFSRSGLKRWNIDLPERIRIRARFVD